MVKSDKLDILPPLTIETMVNGGAGLTHYDGRVIFVPHVAVGDQVVCQLTRQKKQYAEAKVIELLEAGPQRRHAPCPVAGQCGGCQWQHLAYDAQCLWKEKLFRDTLIRQCHIAPGKVLSLVPADAEWFYRSRAQVKCKNIKGRFLTGFYRPKSHFVVAVCQCHILAPSLNRLLTELRELFDGTCFAGSILQLDLALDDHNKRCVTVHYEGKEKDKLGRFLTDSDLDADILVQSAGQKMAEKIKGQGGLQIKVSEPLISLNYSAGSFAQINLSQNRKLVKTVVNLAGVFHGMRIVDLYCGMGNFTLPVAQAGAYVTGIEESSSSIRQAISNAELNGLNETDFICGNATDKFHEIANIDQLDLLLLDPPRNGAFELLKSIIEEQILPDKIIYVSCDPQTLARDLNLLLQNSYHFISSQPFDLFPQTHHCESVTLLERN